MKVEKVSNGYIIHVNEWGGLPEIAKTLEEVFARMLLHFEGRSSHFCGNCYGKVTVTRKLPEEWIVPRTTAG